MANKGLDPSNGQESPATAELVAVCKSLVQEVNGMTEDTEAEEWIKGVLKPLAARAGRAVARVETGGKTYPMRFDLLEAAQAVLAIVGDEDLPDNGELSGAAVIDMLRAAVEQEAQER